MKIFRYKAIFSAFKLISFIEGICCFIGLLLIPSENNGFFLGLSFGRVALLGLLLLETTIMFFWYLLRNNSRIIAFEDNFANSLPTFCFFVLVFYITFVVFIFLKEHESLFTRLLPELLFIGLFSFQFVLYLLFFSEKRTKFVEPVINWLENGSGALWFSVIISFPILFFDAFANKYPLGFSGLYTLMAQEVKSNGFILPSIVPYYGPGGIPFAYPPLGAYLMGFFLKLGVSQWNYLRFAPPFFSLLAILCMYLLVKKLTRSNLAAVVVSILSACSFDLFYLQTESGGIVRGLAYFLGLLSVYLFIKLIEKPNWIFAILTGLAFGLCTLSHLGYAYYFVFWLIAWFITHKAKKNFFWSFLAGFIAFLSISPWLISVISRYGLNVLINAFQTHKTTYFLQIFSNVNWVMPAVLKNLNVLISDWKLLSLVIIGLIGLMIKKEFAFPLLFLFNSLIIFEGDRFVLFLSFVLGGYGLKFLFDIFTKNDLVKYILLKKSFFVFLISIILIFSYKHSFSIITSQSPLVDQEMISAANYLKTNSSEESKYFSLFQGDSQADEWIPYLSNRVPLIGFWGSEWTGQAIQQEELAKLQTKCSQLQEFTCVESIFEKLNEKPNYLFVQKQLGLLSENLRINKSGKVIYENSKYLLFQYFPE